MGFGADRTICVELSVEVKDPGFFRIWFHKNVTLPKLEQAEAIAKHLSRKEATVPPPVSIYEVPLSLISIEELKATLADPGVLEGLSECSEDEVCDFLNFGDAETQIREHVHFGKTVDLLPSTMSVEFEWNSVSWPSENIYFLGAERLTIRAKKHISAHCAYRGWHWCDDLKGGGRFHIDDFKDEAECIQVASTEDEELKIDASKHTFMSIEEEAVARSEINHVVKQFGFKTIGQVGWKVVRALSGG